MSDDLTSGVLEETYARLRATGPEFDGWLSNHGPMAVEAMVRHGHADAVGPWVDGYARRLEEAPAATEAITGDTWHEALGDPRRLGDWPVWFERELAEADWRDVLATWWPRLLPGIAAGATHGVIRTGHAVHTLLRRGATEPGLGELAQALGYWAARWQPVAAPAARGARSPAAALAAVPRLVEQSGGINARLARLSGLRGLAPAQEGVAGPSSPAEVPPFLREVVTAAVVDYAAHGHGEPTMLVHAATAPNAVLRTLPALPQEQWRDAARYAWAATTAVRAAYVPAQALVVTEERRAPDELMAAAVRHGDEHLVKLADTALDAHSWTADPTTLAAVARGLEHLDPA